MGTPSDLLTAILNGMSEKPLSRTGQAELIQMHIRDYLRQKFAVAMLRAGHSKEIEAAVIKLARDVGGIIQEQPKKLEAA